MSIGPVHLDVVGLFSLFVLVVIGAQRDFFLFIIIKLVIDIILIVFIGKIAVIIICRCI